MRFAFGQFMNQKLNVWNETFIIHYSLSIGNGICTVAEPIHFRQVSGVYYTKHYMDFFFLKKKGANIPPKELQMLNLKSLKGLHLL